jgi:hypothetical protein
MERINQCPLPDGDPPHDWRTHVPNFIRKAWPRLSIETRICVFAIAHDEADQEEWD